MLEAPGNTTVVEVLAEAGVDVVTSCSKGVCGTCEVDVLDGEIDHRDAILDDDERASNTCMFPCVSRSLPLPSDSCWTSNRLEKLHDHEYDFEMPVQ